MTEPKRPRVLVVDDQISMAEMVADGLAERGFDAVPIDDSQVATARLEGESFDALVTDLRMPKLDGLELLAIARRLAPDRPVIVMTAFSAVETAVESIRQGAYHYLTKPFKTDELALFLSRALDEAGVRREAAALKRALKERFSRANIVFRSAAMQEVVDLAQRVADADVPVLLTGETGTGKGLVARAIHAEGARAGGPFLTVNCAAIPEALLESELFGHVKGAFTGATGARRGLFEAASGGTLFLDEIGEVPLPLQAKLLRVLETGTVRPVGSNDERRADARIVAATHRNLRARVASGEFREDLLYRLDVVAIDVPPLRLRREDLPMLVDHFFAAARARHARSPARRLAREAMERLDAHPWPGNVRELEHVIERLVLLGRNEEITAAELPTSIGVPREARAAFEGPVIPMREMQRRYARWAMGAIGGKRGATAEALGIDFKTLAKLLEPGEATEE